jgi:hypothetical protein
METRPLHTNTPQARCEISVGAGNKHAKHYVQSMGITAEPPHSYETYRVFSQQVLHI